jgi:arginyl-tRNA--protein-N-Asp/Glu arginylyltransferase
MTLPSDPPLQKLQFYATTPYSCGYLEGKLAQSLIAAPHHLIDANTYSGLIQLGFRRSGKFAYRPHCENCNACVPVRLPVEQFHPNRSQRRAWKHHQSLKAVLLPLTFSQEHYELYAAYQSARHSGGGMDQETADQYRNFLVQSNVDSMLVEFRLDDVLKMISVVDIVRDGISAVYTFYDASDEKASYGTYNVLWLVEWTRSLNLPYLYLGYWIAESRKMAYKQNFAPQEGLVDGEWQPLKQLNNK